MNPLDKQKHLDKIVKNIIDAGEKNIIEKRKNFEHLMLLIGTILGFSVGLTATTNSEPGCFLIFSWVADIVVIIIGSVYLVLEAESRYYRTFVTANKQIDLVNKNEAEVKEAIKTLWRDINKTFLDISTGENIKEKMFIAFAKYQHKIEICFYSVFILSLLLLVVSFL